MNEREMRAMFYNEMVNATEELYWKLRKENWTHDEIQSAFVDACVRLTKTDIEPPNA